MHTATASPRLLFVEAHLDPITSLTEEAAHWWLVGTQPAKFLSSSAESSVALRSLNLGGARAGNLVNPIHISAREALFAILDVCYTLYTPCCEFRAILGHFWHQYSRKAAT